MAAFDKLGLAAWLKKIIREMGYVAPRPIQEHCIPPILQGRDVIGCSETGSGKTAAFALPILHKLAEDPIAMYALVLTPTRELAVQIAEQMLVFGAPIPLQLCLVVGGRDMIRQALELDKKPHAVVATPGRMADHLRSTNTVKLNRIKYLVLDEADRLLDGGFDEDLRVIFRTLPETCQKLMFSATLPQGLEKRVEELSGHPMKNPFRFDATDRPTTVSTLTQQYLFIPPTVKSCYLIYLVRSLGDKSMIIFAGKCRTAARVQVMLKELGISAVALHSELSQEQRMRSLEQFRSLLVKILVATDVASRGLDIPEVEVVISYDVAISPEVYIHRSGRTARAGRSGLALSIITPKDVAKHLEIENAIGTKMTEYETNEDEVLKHLNEARIAERIAEMYLEETGFGEKTRINKLKHKQKLLQSDGVGEPKRKKKKNEDGNCC